MDIQNILSRMTFEEKCKLVSGGSNMSTAVLEEYGISAVRMVDGPHGVRCEREKTERIFRPCFYSCKTDKGASPL